MKTQKLPKVLCYIGRNEHNKGMALSNNFKTLADLQEDYTDEQEWMESLVEDMQLTANRFNTQVILSKGLIKRMQATAFSSDKIQDGCYVKPDYSEYEKLLPEGLSEEERLTELLNLVATDAYGQLS